MIFEKEKNWALGKFCEIVLGPQIKTHILILLLNLVHSKVLSVTLVTLQRANIFWKKHLLNLRQVKNQFSHSGGI